MEHIKENYHLDYIIDRLIWTKGIEEDLELTDEEFLIKFEITMDYIDLYKSQLKLYWNMFNDGAEFELNHYDWRK
jgi:hypothetical protein